MILRPYQSRLVSRAVKALETHGNTLAVAATGAGKTICLSALAERIGGRQLVLQHRQELVSQNAAKYKRMNPGRRIGLFTADTKSWHGDAIFAMAQTLSRKDYLRAMPPLDLLILDEAHHAAAPTWRAIIDAAREKNPACKIAGFTATPERTDRKGLRGVFSNICDAVTIGELVKLGFLVPPKAYVVDVGGTSQALAQVKGSDFGDQAEVEEILNTTAVNDEVVRHWRDKAGERRTIVFCSTVRHAQDVASAFGSAGVAAACVHGAMPDAERQTLLCDLARGRLQVLCNVMVLTEGFDCPPVSCVILLRKCSAKSPLIQMVGRGLRTVNPEEYPGVKKRDCVVLDFGTSLLTHGDIQADAILAEERELVENEAQTKICPTEESEVYRVPDGNGQVGCGAELPAQTRVCPLCGFRFERLDAVGDERIITRVELTEMDILDASPFRYVDLFGTGCHLMASGFAAWAGVFSVDGEAYSALGYARNNGRRVHQLTMDVERVQALASADDWMREHETEGAAKKTKGWLDQPASAKQCELLNRFGYGLAVDLLGGCQTLTKYQAACHANFQFSRDQIEVALGVWG